MPTNLPIPHALDEVVAEIALIGEPQQQKSTDAANYTDGSQNPLIVLDNIEARLG